MAYDFLDARSELAVLPGALSELKFFLRSGSTSNNLLSGPITFTLRCTLSLFLETVSTFKFKTETDKEKHHPPQLQHHLLHLKRLVVGKLDDTRRRLEDRLVHRHRRVLISREVRDISMLQDARLLELLLHAHPRQLVLDEPGWVLVVSARPTFLIFLLAELLNCILSTAGLYKFIIAHFFFLPFFPFLPFFLPTDFSFNAFFICILCS